MNQDERLIAVVVRDLPEGAEAVDSIGAEAIREGGPRYRAAQGPADYLFIWGHRPEIYYWSGLLPASRYISTQPLTGIPADVHYQSDDYRAILDDRLTAQARAELIQDLKQAKPKYIVDDLAMHNANLSINEYPELRAFMSDYRQVKAYERFFIYIRRDLWKKDHLH